MNNSKDLAMFISCVFAGFLVGIVYDMLRALRKGLKLKKLIPLLDTLFWLTVVYITYIVLYKSGEGTLKAFAFPGLCGGFAVYILSFSRILGTWMVVSVGKVRKAAQIICEKLFLPVCCLFKRIKSIIGGIVQNIQKYKRIFVGKNIEKY